MTSTIMRIYCQKVEFVEIFMAIINHFDFHKKNLLRDSYHINAGVKNLR